MKNETKVLATFLLNCAGWVIFNLPTLPGEPRLPMISWIGFGIFNLLCAYQCHLWLTKR